MRKIRIKKEQKKLLFVALGVVALFAFFRMQGTITFALVPTSGYIGMDYPYCSQTCKGLKYEILNPIVTQARPFEMRSGLEFDSSFYSPPARAGRIQFFVDGVKLDVHDGSAQGYGGGLQVPYAGELLQVPLDKFLGKTGKNILRIDVWDYGEGCFRTFDVEVWVDDASCVLSEGTMVIAESFSAGNTVYLSTLRFPVKSFCSTLPILVTQEGRVVEQRVEEYSTLKSSYVTIPAGQVWTFFYIATVTEEMTVICREGTYNPETGQCEVVPGIIWVCSVGIFDPVEGFCIVQPDVRYICELGYYDTGQQACIYQIPEGQTISVCPEGSEVVVGPDSIERCVYQPDFDYLCGSGVYDATAGVCKYVPQPYPGEGVGLWEMINSLWSEFIAWITGVLGW